VSEPPRHTSLAREFSAAVPPQRALMKGMSLRLVQKIIERRYRA
jgi:hypothetical protein